MSGMELLRAQLCQSNSAFWWAAKLIVLALLYTAIFTIPRPQSAPRKGQGICSQSQAEFVCACIKKRSTRALVHEPKAGPI